MNCIQIYKMFIFIVFHIAYLLLFLIIVIITVIKISNNPFFVNYFFEKYLYSDNCVHLFESFFFFL